MLSGLMSRWTTPLMRVTERVGDVAQDADRLRRRAASPRGARRSRSDSPSTNGIVKYGSPSACPTRAPARCADAGARAASWISRLNRSMLSAAASSGGSTFTTTRAPERAFLGDEDARHAAAAQARARAVGAGQVRPEAGRGVVCPCVANEERMNAYWYKHTLLALCSPYSSLQVTENRGVGKPLPA